MARRAGYGARILHRFVEEGANPYEFHVAVFCRGGRCYQIAIWHLRSLAERGMISHDDYAGYKLGRDRGAWDEDAGTKNVGADGDVVREVGAGDREAP